MTSVDQETEMYLAPAATGVYDWVSLRAPLASAGVSITRGLGRLNSDPGPGRISFSVVDQAGDLNPKNPMGLYFGSLRLGSRLRHSVLRVNDQCGRTVADTNWGSVGNVDNDVWTAGASAGGSVTAADWSVSSGKARHSVPAAAAYRVSELSKATRLHIDYERHLRITVPVNSMSGTGGMTTDVWFRCLDTSNFVGVSLRFAFDETVQIRLFDRVAGTDRYLKDYTTIPGLTLAAGHTDYELRCQVEGTTVRAKVWEVGTAEPLDWQAYASQATIREGYASVVTGVETGNANTKPLVMAYDFIRDRLPIFTGETTVLKSTGDGKDAARVTEVEAADILDRLVSSAPTRSAMFRGYTSVAQWMGVGIITAGSGTVRTFVLPTASIGLTAVGDFFFLADSTGKTREETKFVITSSSVGGGNTTYTFTPDARDAVVVGDQASAFRPTASTNLPVAYWPCEEGKSATQVKSGLVGGLPMQSYSGSTPEFSSVSDLTSTAPFLKMNDADLIGLIPDYTDTYQSFHMQFILSMPDTDEAATGTDIFQFLTSGTGYFSSIQYTAAGGGSLRLQVFNSSIAALYDSGALDTQLRGNSKMITLKLEQVGGTVTYSLYATPEIGSVVLWGPTVITGVTTLGKLRQVRVNPGGGFVSAGFGQLAVRPGTIANSREFGSWRGEGVLRRLMRLCHEEQIAFTEHSDRDVLSATVGNQKIDKLIEQIKQPAQSDDGFVYGPKGQLGIECRTRGSLTNQTAIATFSYSGNQLQDFEPTYDTTDIKNFVTVNRVDGATAIAEETAGPLSTANPPTGIGRRDDSFTLSISSDTLVQRHADWRLGIGVIDQYRVPDFTVKSAMTRDLTVERLCSINLGSRVDITNASARNIYDTLPQLVLGYTLKLGNRFAPELKMNCAPYDIYSCPALTADRYSRPDGYDTVTSGTLTTTATGSLSVTSGRDRLWTTDAADFPLDIMLTGERITLSGIADVSVTAGTQTFTISARSANGVIKTHAVGESVVLAEPNYWQF